MRIVIKLKPEAEMNDAIALMHAIDAETRRPRGKISGEFIKEMTVVSRPEKEK